MNPPAKNYVFGPVPSCRIGRSLGVDLVPFKTCTYDCIYCQLGSTTHLTLERKEWVPMDAVLEELKRKLVCRPDYITLSGSGEPTLYARLGHKTDKLQPGDVLEMLRRRPCTVDQVALGLRLNRMEVIKQLEALMAEKHIESYRHEGGVFYRASAHQQPS